MAHVRLTAEGIQQEIARISRNVEQVRQRLAGWQDAVVACTPSTSVATWGKATLLHYAPTQQQATACPLLLIYSLVNRPHVLDLCPGSSLIGALVARGYDTYLIDWGTPTQEDSGLGLAAYVVDALDTLRACVQRRHGGTAPALVGVCQGGMFALCHALLRPELVRHVITLVTPVDFHTAEDHFSRQLRALDVDALVDLTGNVPAEALNAFFLTQKPVQHQFGKYVDFVARADDEVASARFLAMERWIYDSPPLAGAIAREFVDTFVRRNALMNGGLELAGRRLDLAQLRQPVLNIWASDDHLVPPAAARALAGLIGSNDYAALQIDGGHIGALVSPRNVLRVADEIAGWIRQRNTDPAEIALGRPTRGTRRKKSP